jgi:hypothetical protein
MASNQPAINPARFLLLAVCYVALSIIILLNIVSIKPALHGLLDFGSFIAAGKEAAAGNNPYSVDSPLVYQIQSQSTGQTLPSPNLNPPISVLLFRRMAHMKPVRAVSVWRILSGILFLLGISVLTGSYGEHTTPLRILWAISLAGLWNTIALGQIYMPIFLLAVGAWILMEKGKTSGAGILLGIIIAVKPNFAFWLALLGLAGYTRTMLSAAITTLILSAIPVLVFGTQIYQQWITSLLDYPSLGLMIAGNSSLSSLAARLRYENLGSFLSLVLAGFVAYFTSRNKHVLSLHEVNSLGVVSSILISPFSWAGYAILTVPIFFSKQRWSWPDKLAAACLVFPYPLILYFFRSSLFNSILFGWLYGWGLLLILIGIFIARKKSFVEDRQGSPA